MIPTTPQKGISLKILGVIIYTIYQFPEAATGGVL